MDSKYSLSLSNFAARFCNELEKGRNAVCSPLSAQAVLSLTALGSSGETKAELLRAMTLPDDDAIRSVFGYLTSILKSVQTVKLRFANRIYIENHGTLKPQVLKDAVEVFGSGLQQVDFTENEAAADIINKWIAEQTENKIKNMVSPAMLDADTRLLLVNAIYFQGTWAMPFDKKFTEENTFYVNNTTTRDVPMMFRHETYFRYRHSVELKAQLLQLNYRGNQASMILVVPDAVEGLGSMLEQLAAGHDLLEEVTEMRSMKMEVMMPKFKIETDIDLNGLLSKMGINNIFDKNKSDIRMLTSDGRLFVSKAMQKAIIEVDEDGTVAAVCTIGEIFDCCGFTELEPPMRFVADRPFLYVLLVRGIPVFLGTYTE